MTSTNVAAFVDTLVEDLAGAATTVMTVVGDRLGLYAAMAGAGPLTAAALAARTRLHPRLVTEWLAAQTVARYVAHDPQRGTYELPDGHAEVLAVADSPAHLVGAAEIVVGQFELLDALVEAFRGTGEIGELPENVHRGVERYFATAYAHELARTWFPAVPGLTARLAAGARVADVGCGRGRSTLEIARRWPACRVVGFDHHAPSIERARAAAEDVANAAFTVADATAIGPGPFDVVTFFDSLHDMGDPDAALRHARESLVPGGRVVVVEPWSVDRLEDGIGHPGLRIDYSASTSLCTPGALAQRGRCALGALGGPTVRLRLLTGAGFDDPILAADTGVNLVLAATAPIAA